MNTPFTPRLLFFQCQYALYAEVDQQWDEFWNWMSQKEREEER